MQEKIKKFLEEKGYNVKLVNSRIVTEHHFENFKIQISGELDCNNFPFSLPKLFLLDRRKYGLLAHVGWDIDKKQSDEGLICEGVSENRHVDYDKPEEVYLLSLNKAVQTIKELLLNKEKNNEEVVKEFSAHWRFLIKDENHRVINFLEPSEHIFEIKPVVSVDLIYNNVTFFVNDSYINPEYSFIKRLKKNGTVKGKGIYLPIIKPILPPSPSLDIKEWWMELLKQLNDDSVLELKEKLHNQKSKIFWLLSSIQFEENKYSWFCIKFVNQTRDYFPLTINSMRNGWNVFAHNVILHNRECLGSAKSGLFTPSK
ncbi:MAG: hypothetical protein H7A23_09295 [Leptospiraceae bacterium]|nr:hypothetical protein [Leptospiraceae bacterium]MCP5494738.1 hypothetical protein [Leptospiraceae bacterium]